MTVKKTVRSSTMFRPMTKMRPIITAIEKGKGAKGSNLERFHIARRRLDVFMFFHNFLINRNRQ